VGNRHATRISAQHRASGRTPARWPCGRRVAKPSSIDFARS